MNNFTIVNITTELLTTRNSGKSCLLKYLVEAERNKFNKIFVICLTEKLINFIVILLIMIVCLTIIMKSG